MNTHVCWVALCWLLLSPATLLSAELRSLDSHCPFHPPSDLKDWKARAAELRLQLQVSTGTFPGLTLDPAQPEIYGKIQRDGYTIEKLVFESLPGLFITGNLYRPDDIPEDARLPGVLCPHGHWTEARFYEAGKEEVRNLLAKGAERFENAAINHIQARCVQLARMGCVVFHWDMLGYCDSQQISMERAHGFRRQQEQSSSEGWLLYSPRAEANLQSVMGLQTLASLRAVDALLTLPEVDPERIAITGASGGGTQSFIAAALDPRISVAFPAVMVSTGMQGGCTCENASLLRVGTGNVEMAGLIAPRPLGLTAADDWTKNMANDGFPELQKLYALYDAEDLVALFPATHFGHNFNHVSRTAMYGWINQHFGLGFPSPVLEADFELATREELTVWDDEHPQPSGGLDFERRLLSLWSEMAKQQLHGLLQGDRQQRLQLAEILRGGWRVCLGLTTLDDEATDIQHEVNSSGGFDLQAETLEAWELRPQPDRQQADNSDFGLTQPPGMQKTEYLVDVWKPVDSDLHIEIANLEAAKQPLRYYPQLLGETTADKLDAEGDYVFLRTVQQPLVRSDRLAAAYTYGYNLPLFAKRAQQLGLSLKWLSEEFPERDLIVRGNNTQAALAAAGLFCYQQAAGDANREHQIALEIDPQGFSFESVDDIRAPDFLPGSARFMDLAGLLASLRDTRITILGDDQITETMARIHRLQNNEIPELKVAE